MDQRHAAYLPNLFSLGFKVEHERPGEARPAYVAMVTISRPDKHGCCHFGPHNWTKRDAVRHAPRLTGSGGPEASQQGDVGGR